MNLSLQTQKIGNVAVIRCRGRLVVGAETQLLQAEVDKWSLETKKILLQLGEVTYLDSGALGALVRLHGSLRAHHGDLKLCQVSPFVHTVLKATNLLGVLHPHQDETSALSAFSQRAVVASAGTGKNASPNGTRVLCVDPSSDVLSYMAAILQRAGFEVQSTRYLSDAMTLSTVSRPHAIVCGPGVQTTGAAYEKFRRLDSRSPFLMLPADFHTSDAGDAGLDLVQRVQALLPPPA
jgi:anti-sigma B factor antagonist